MDSVDVIVDPGQTNTNWTTWESIWTELTSPYADDGLNKYDEYLFSIFEDPTRDVFIKKSHCPQSDSVQPFTNQQTSMRWVPTHASARQFICMDMYYIQR